MCFTWNLYISNSIWLRSWCFSLSIFIDLNELIRQNDELRKNFQMKMSIQTWTHRKSAKNNSNWKKRVNIQFFFLSVWYSQSHVVDDIHSLIKPLPMRLIDIIAFDTLVVIRRRHNKIKEKKMSKLVNDWKSIRKSVWPQIWMFVEFCWFFTLSLAHMIFSVDLFFFIHMHTHTRTHTSNVAWKAPLRSRR